MLYNQTWDAENRLKVVTNTLTGEVTKFIYDGDGNRVLQVYSGTYTSTMLYLGTPAEITILGAPLPPPTVTVTIPPTMTYRTYLPLVLGGQAAPPRTQPLANETWKMYYAVGNQLAAMRLLTVTGSMLYYLHSDHLGSTSLATDASGAAVPNSRQMYYPYGELRVRGTSLPTDIGFTGQRADATGLMYYRARYYSVAVGRFASADTMVPDFSNPQSLNRFSYVRNNPLKYIDPSGHREVECGPGDPGCDAQGRLLQTRIINARVFYLNAIGNVSGNVFQPSTDPNDMQGFILNQLGVIAGANNVKHIPVYTGGDANATRWQMFNEAFLSNEYGHRL